MQELREPYFTQAAGWSFNNEKWGILVFRMVNEMNEQKIDSKRNWSKTVNDFFRSRAVVRLSLVGVCLIAIIINCYNSNKSQYSLFEQTIINENKISAYFSYPGKYEDREKYLETENAILEFIRNTKFSLKIYAYSFDNPLIIQELDEARKRGVEIKLVLDKDEDYSKLKEKGFPYNIWKKSGLHHIKLMYSDNKSIFTGTGNFSEYGPTHDWNGYISMKIPAEKSLDFLNFAEERLEAPGIYVNGILFINSPEQGKIIQDTIISEIDRAKSSINYLIFDHYDQVITQALRNASARGVLVQGIYNDPVDPEGIYLNSYMRGGFSSIYKDGNQNIIETNSFPLGGLLHHKTMIIDNKTLLTGSYNYSLSARDSNRELFMKTNNVFLIQEFSKEFERIKSHSYYLEKKSFPISTNENHFSEISIDKNGFCSPVYSDQTTVLMGDGIFKSYLYFSSKEKTNCLQWNESESISSGFFGQSSNYYYPPGSWLRMKLFERNANLINTLEYSNDNPFYKEIFPEEIELEELNFFKNNDLFIQFKEMPPSLINKLYIWSKGKGIIQAIKINYFEDKKSYLYHLPLDINQSAGILLFETENKTHISCYNDSNAGLDPAISFLIQKIRINSIEKEKNKFPKQLCFNR